MQYAINASSKAKPENFYICETCEKDVNKEEISRQIVSNKMALNPVPDELKDLKIVESLDF